MPSTQATSPLLKMPLRVSPARWKPCALKRRRPVRIVPGSTIRAYQEMSATIQPIRDEAIDEAYSDHLMDFADQGERADQAMEREQMAAALKLAIDKLNDREQMILQLYFVEELNLDEIGQVLGVGAARVCQIKKSALTKVRALMVEEEDYA